VLADYAKIKALNPEMILSVRLPLDEAAAGRAAEMTRAGVGVIYLQAGMNGQGFGAKKDLFITKLVREVHLALVEEGIRDRVTLMASGGIALAEHWPRSSWRGRRRRHRPGALRRARMPPLQGLPRRAFLPGGDRDGAGGVATQRLVNLVGALHSQMIEVMGAMGLREARRLRGEVGRAMFFDDLEREMASPGFRPAHKEQTFPASGNGQAQRESGNGAAPAAPPTMVLPDGFDFKSWRFGNGSRLAKPMASRYRNQFGKFKVVRTTACQACGRCAEVWPTACTKRAARACWRPSRSSAAGPSSAKPRAPIAATPAPTGAARRRRSALGDDRRQALDGRPAPEHLDPGRNRPPARGGLRIPHGRLGGGWTGWISSFPAAAPDASFTPEQVDLQIPLNRRDDGRPEVVIGFPIYGGG